MSNHGRTGFVKWICCWTQVSVVLKGRLDPKVPPWGSEVDMTTENKLHSEFIIKLFCLIYSDHIWSSDSCLLKRLHTFFPSMCRPAPRRLKWFTAGHITTVIRDRRIYNFLSLNTSLRIIFFTTAPIELCFTDSALYCFLCRPCCLCLPSLWRGGYSDINRACVEMFEPPLSPSAGEDQDCGASVPCTRALRGTEERHGKEHGVKQE